MSRGRNARLQRIARPYLPPYILPAAAVPRSPKTGTMFPKTVTAKICGHNWLPGRLANLEKSLCPTVPLATPPTVAVMPLMKAQPRFFEVAGVETKLPTPPAPAMSPIDSPNIVIVLMTSAELEWILELFRFDDQNRRCH